MENCLPEITVIVPVYNVEESLDKCVKSICDQTFSDLEILLVDDGSKDNSGTLCDVLANKDSRIRVIHKENGGLSDARNIGVREAKGKYVGFVDSDDYISPEMYSVLYNNLKKEDADVSSCTHFLCLKNNTEQVSEKIYTVMSGIDFFGLSLTGKYGIVSSCVKLYKKELLINTPFKKGRLYEDAFLMGELFPKVDRVVFDSTPLYYYVRHKGTITTNNYSNKKMDNLYASENNLRIAEKYCPQFLEAAQYRLFRSSFEIIDSILISGDNKENKNDKKKVKKIIRENFIDILTNKYIVFTRKTAIIIFLLSERIYKFMLYKKRNNVKD